jgi:putative transposase
MIDELFLETPWYGSRQVVRHLRRNGWCVGRHRVLRLMTKMGLAPIYQHPKTSEPHPQHKAWRLSNTMDADSCVAALEEVIVRHAG